MGAIHVRKVGPSQKRPLNAESYIPIRQSQAFSGTIRILRRRTRHGNIAASGRAPGLPALPSAGQPRNERHPCPGRPKPKRPLNAKPRTAAQQSQGASVEVRILRRSTRHESIAASGRAPGLPALLSAGQPRNERHPCQSRPKPKRPLNAKPRTAAQQSQGGQRRNPHPPAQGKTREHRCQWPGARTTGVAVRRAASE